MRGVVERAVVSKNGASIGLKIGDQWIRTKDIKLGESLKGQEIVCEPGVQTFANGDQILWLNEYTVVGQAPVPVSDRSSYQTPLGADELAHTLADHSAQPVQGPSYTDKDLHLGIYSTLKAEPRGNRTAEEWVDFCERAVRYTLSKRA